MPPQFTRTFEIVRHPVSTLRKLVLVAIPALVGLLVLMLPGTRQSANAGASVVTATIVVLVAIAIEVALWLVQNNLLSRAPNSITITAYSIAIDSEAPCAWSEFTKVEFQEGRGVEKKIHLALVPISGPSRMVFLGGRSVVTLASATMPNYMEFRDTLQQACPPEVFNAWVHFMDTPWLRPSGYGSSS